jgi:hypothetical protein
MAKIEDPNEQEQAAAAIEKVVPEQRHAPEQEQEKAAPSITVIGYMEKQVAIHRDWKPGMVVISPSRLRFLRDDLGIDVSDDPQNYLF